MGLDRLDAVGLQASVSTVRSSEASSSHASGSAGYGSSMEVERRRAVLRRMWVRMAAIYPHAWVTGVGESPEKPDGSLRIQGDEWMRAIAGLSEDEIAAGIEACRLSSSPFVPKPAEFRGRCLGIPDLAVVRDEIDTRTYSRFTRLVLQGGVDHNGVRWPGLDWTRYRSEPAASAMRLLELTYKRAHDHVMRGGALPEQPAAAIEEERREFKPADPAKVADHFAKLERLLGVGRPDSPGVPA